MNDYLSETERSSGNSNGRNTSGTEARNIGQLYRDIAKIGRVGGWEISIDSNDVTWTEETFHIHEVPSDFIPTASNGLEFYAPSSRPVIDHLLQLAIEQGEPFDEVLEIVTARGNQRYVRVIGDVELEKHRVFGVFQDVTERRRGEIFIEMSRDVLQVLNEGGELRGAIQQVIALLKERTGCDAVGIRLQEAEDFPYFVQKGFSIDFLMVENTLVERSADGGVCRDENGQVSLECTCGLVLSGKTDPIHPLFTPGGSFWTNDAVPLLDLPANQDPRHNPRNNCIHAGYASVALIPIRTMDKIIGLVQFNDRRTGRFTRNIIELFEEIATHIGEKIIRKWSLEKLHQKDDEIERLIYSVSHDMRSPLVTVKSFLGYLREDIALGDAEKVTDDIGYIVGAADKMELMLNELLQMSRIGRVQEPSVTVPLSEIIASVRDTLAGSIKDRNVTINLIDTDVMFCGEKNRLCQIWQNLIENSIKYSREGVTPCITLGTQQRGGDTYFYVADNGIGVAPHHTAAIFRVFEKLSPKSTGVGIGLSLVQRIVEKNGGRIWVESAGVGKGACFYFNLPHAMG